MLLFLFGFFTGYVILIIAREAWKWKPLTNKKKRRAKDNGLSGDFDVDRAKLEDTANDDQCKSSSSKRLRKCLNNDCMSCELIYSDKYIFEAYQERTLNFLYKLNFLRKEKQFCDVKIITEDGKEIWAHKNVLSSNCEYFERMFSGTFKESNLYEVIIKHIPNDVLEEIISFIYTSQLAITEQNVENLLVASNFMLLDDVCQSCEEYLKNLTTPENCIDILKIADDHNLNGLQKFCMSYAMDHFEFLATTTSFLNSPLHQIKYLIANDNLCAKEETVCSAVINWVKSFEETRLKDLPGLLHYVRFTLISSDYLKNIMKSEPIIYSNPKCTYYFFEAFAWHSQIIERKLSNLADTFQRKPLKKSIVVLCSSNNLTDLTSFRIKWFDPIIYQWLSYPCNLTVPWKKSTLFMVNGSQLFAIGGQEDESDRGLKSFGKFNVETNSWEELSEMKCRRITPGVVIYKNRIYVFGGQKIYQESLLCNGEYFDLDTKKWYSVRRMHTKRSDFTLFVINGLIYPIEKANGSSKDIITECYNPDINLWTRVKFNRLHHKRYNSAICILNNIMYVAGGLKNGKVFKCVDTYNFKTYTWSSVVDMNIGRFNASAISLNGRVYVIGGESEIHKSGDDSNDILNSVEVYDPAYNKWNLLDIHLNCPDNIFSLFCLVVIADNYCNYTEYPYSYVEWYDYVTCQWIKHRTTWKPPFMDPRYYVLDNCSLLAIGGRNLNGDAIKTVRVFDSKSTRWHHMTDMNCRRHDPGVVQFGNRLYVIGGCKKFDKEIQRGGEYYDMCTGKWHCIQRMVHGRESFGIGVINDYIYVVGGHGIGIFTSGERYDPRSNTWSPIPSMPICRDGPFICFLNKQIYVIGGWVGGSCSKSADVFDTSTNKWKSIADMEYGRSYASGGILNGQIYVIGGISGAINDGSRMILNTTEVYDPSKNKWSLAKGVLSEDTAQRRHIGLVCDRSVSFLRKSIKDV